MSKLSPIYFKINKPIRFVIIGKPWVQKNNLHIFYKNPRKKIGAFIGHSNQMEQARNRLSVEMCRQYRNKGWREPIDYYISVDFVFYCERAHEPDLDNLPAIVLDAMQGVTINGHKVGAVLVDDKLVREEHSLKIVKGDVDYHGKPRTEIEISRYFGGSRIK